jgi:hypothetical protein
VSKVQSAEVVEAGEGVLFNLHDDCGVKLVVKCPNV